MGSFYDRQGNTLTPDEFYKQFKPAAGPDGEPDPSRHVARNTVNDALGREHYVSTVWLGIDHSFGEGPPLIFETMIFCHDHECWLNEWQHRYSTEEQAQDGHAGAVAMVKAFRDD